MSVAAIGLLDRHIIWFTRIIRAIYSLGEDSGAAGNACIEIGKRLRSIARRIVDYYASQGSVDTLLYLFSKSGVETVKKIRSMGLLTEERYDGIKNIVESMCREGGSQDAVAHSLLLLFLLRVLSDIYGIDVGELDEVFDALIEKMISDSELLEALDGRILCALASARRSVEAYIKAGEE
jgi:CRISPR type III-B/RAMP module-associated protein Cmr5